jgi:hypothetical protein
LKIRFELELFIYYNAVRYLIYRYSSYIHNRSKHYTSLYPRYSIMSTTGLLEGVEYSAHQGLATEEGDETVLAPETSADIAIEEQDGTV